MGKLKDLEKIVRNILQETPATRGSDDLLYTWVCYKMGFGLKGRDAQDFILSYRRMGIPTIESVGRCRRKLQEKDEALKPTPDIVLKRKRLENSYYCYSLGRKENV